MHFLFKSSGKDTTVEGVDWIVLTANALGVAIVIAATMHANAPSGQIATAQTDADFHVASLD